MRIRLTIDIDIDGIDEAGDVESEGTLHSLARSYMLHQYGDATDYINLSGIEAFEDAVIDTVINDGIGEVAIGLGHEIHPYYSFVEVLP